MRHRLVSLSMAALALLTLVAAAQAQAVAVVHGPVLGAGGPPTPPGPTLGAGSGQAGGAPGRARTVGIALRQGSGALVGSLPAASRPRHGGNSQPAAPAPPRHRRRTPIRKPVRPR